MKKLVARTFTIILICILSCRIYAQPIMHVESPSFQSRYFQCLSARLTKDKTILTYKFKASNAVKKFWVDRNTYLQTFDNSHKYKLLYVKNATYNEYDAKTIYDTTDYSEIFEPLPANCTRFKYYHSDGSYDIYDLSSYSGRKIIYSDNRNSYNFNRVADAFSKLFNDNQNMIKVCSEQGDYLPKLSKIEVAFNYPMITLVCRFNDSGSEWAFEYRFNVNDTQIEEYVIDNGKRFYVINSGSGVICNHLESYHDREDYIIGSDSRKYIYFNSDYPILNRRIGNALLALLKVSRNQNASIAIDFDNTPSGMSFINMTRKTRSTTNNKSSKGGTKNRSQNRVPTLKKTK